MSEVFEKDDYFKIDPECHMVGNSEPWEYFPGVQMWWKSIDSVKRPLTLGIRGLILEWKIKNRTNNRKFLADF